MSDVIESVAEGSVRRRYARAATKVEPELCCPSVGYDAERLANVPDEIVDVDYGCGDPTRWIQPDETVLDLGSGSGKVCYLAAQVVGPKGRVIGVDFNTPMLDVARRHQPEFARRLGYGNMRFAKGRIQDLALDLDDLESWLRERPVNGADEYLAMQEKINEMRTTRPMIESDSVDCIVSNCVLNLVEPSDKHALFAEMYRVLRAGGRAVISDIVCDTDVPESLQRDPVLWSGCISGAFREDALLDAFERAGFYGIEILERADEPWQVVEGIEFRSVTVRAYKGKEGPCMDRNQAVIYRGPWKAVVDDDGHTLYRGERMAVCDKTFKIYNRQPYAPDIKTVPPRIQIPPEDAQPFDCRRNARRSPRESKGADYAETRPNSSDSCCDGPSGCC